MGQYVEGGAVAPRPVLEIIKNPVYDTVLVATTNTSASFFAVPVGGADTNALNGASKTFSETNMRRAGALATPQQFDIYAITIKFDPINATPAGLLRAELNQFELRTNYNLEIGQKSYLRVRLTTIPEDTAVVVDALAVAADAVHVGWPIASNVFDVSIPEELFDPATQRTFLTGRRVPIHIPSEQQFANTLEMIGGVTLTTSKRVQSNFWGCLKREVQAFPWWIAIGSAISAAIAAAGSGLLA
jgi:hypothetical protein